MMNEPQANLNGLNKFNFDKGQYFFYKAISTNLKYKQAIFGLGMEQIRSKKYVVGWSNYEARLECFDHLNQIKEKYKAPYWDGSSNKKIVLYADQGIGDIIFGMRYLPELSNKNITFYIDSDFELAEVFTKNKYQNQWLRG